MNRIEVCENGVQANNIINQLTAQGFSHDNIYLFTHDDDRTEDLADAAEVETVGLQEEGIVDSVKNVFRKKGDELRSKFESVGLTQQEAEKYESILDEGKVVIVAQKH
ncbi:general stress protein [Lederbergia ruris]|uniref:general stress protein n=1 Tax=Lederbergia ruris TaxID=217495 RepID=UPI0039A0FDF0